MKKLSKSLVKEFNSIKIKESEIVHRAEDHLLAQQKYRSVKFEDKKKRIPRKQKYSSSYRTLSIPEHV